MDIAVFKAINFNEGKVFNFSFPNERKIINTGKLFCGD